MSTLTLNPWRDASPTQRRFITSREFEVCLMGPRGEGKTEAGIRRMTLHAAMQPEDTRPIPWVIARDTWKNLERTTLKSFLNPHPGSFAEQIRPLLKIKGGGEYITLPGFWEAELFGVDSFGDLSRFQSLQLGGLWVEEPAPAAAEDIGGGLEERVITMGITSLRHPCDWRTVQVTSNYPDEGHWSWQRYYVNRIGRLFRIPRGENPFLPSDYRSNMERSLANDKGLLQRLVLGEPGFVAQGEAVTPEYDSLLHRSNVDLEPFPNLVGYRFWDGWHSPSCCICQLTPRGQLQIFELIAGQGMGMQQLISEFVKPAIQTRYNMIPEWVDIGDPTIATADQSNYEQSAAHVIEKELNTYYIAGPTAWSVRKEAMKTGLMKRLPNGQPFILLSNSQLVQPLHQALRGGWHYRKSPSGQIIGKIPVKDKYSNYADGLGYGICEILRLTEGGLIDAYVYPQDAPVYEIPELTTTRYAEVNSGRDPVTGY